jgi:hypothetical protein
VFELPHYSKIFSLTPTLSLRERELRKKEQK